MLAQNAVSLNVAITGSGFIFTLTESEPMHPVADVMVR